jgi:hypothetical protein
MWVKRNPEKKTIMTDADKPGISEKIHEKIKNSGEDFFTKHNNSVSYYEYVKQCESELYKSMSGRKIIYLDVNFWILLRDAKLKRSEPIHEKALAAFQAMASNDIAVFPITDAVFMELLKQSDPTTRMAMAGIIDDLSRGIIIKSFFDRQIEEFHHFIEKILQGQGAPEFPAIESIWAHTPYILGHFQFDTDTDAHTKQIVNKGFYDFFRTLGMSDMIEMINRRSPEASDQKRFEELAKNLSETKRSISTDTPISELYNNEMAGAINGIIGKQFTERMIPLMRKRFPEYTGEIPEDVILDFVQKLVFNGFRLKQSWMAKRLPTLHIHCMLHANMNKDTKRNFKPNDFFDFKHACAALPYCHFFATEKPLVALIKSSKLDKLYSTVVTSSMPELLEKLELPSATPIGWANQPSPSRS